jgi:hypothetical protein
MSSWCRAVINISGWQLRSQNVDLTAVAGTQVAAVEVCAQAQQQQQQVQRRQWCGLPRHSNCSCMTAAAEAHTSSDALAAPLCNCAGSSTVSTLSTGAEVLGALLRCLHSC